MKFQIPEANYTKLQSKIEKLNVKASKLGTEAIVFETLGSRFEDWTNPDGEKVPVKVYEVEISGEAPKLAGWAFVAKLEHEAAGNIIYQIGKVEAPKWARDCAPDCEHCNTKRNRVKTYIFVNEAGDEFKQVGSTCLKDFSGHANPERLAQWAEYLTALYDEAGAVEWDPEGYSGGSKYFNGASFLVTVAASIRSFGWTSRSAVYEGRENGPATVDVALSAFFAKYNRLEILEADSTLAKAAVKWVREELANKEELNGYEHNLVVCLTDDYITDRQAGIVASVIVAYKREQTRKAELELASKSEYVGTIKKRQVFENLTLVFSTSFPSNYGYNAVVYLYKFADESGNILVWKTGKFFDWSDGQTVVSGKATPKEHSEYQGTKQTVVTRAAFEAVN